MERGSAAEIRSWRSERERAGAERAVRARRREGVGRVGSGAVVVVAKRSKAARMEDSVEAVMWCSFARVEGWFSAGAGAEGGGIRDGGGARGRRFGG